LKYVLQKIILHNFHLFIQDIFHFPKIRYRERSGGKKICFGRSYRSYGDHFSGLLKQPYVYYLLNNKVINPERKRWIEEEQENRAHFLRVYHYEHNSSMKIFSKACLSSWGGQVMTGFEAKRPNTY